MAKTIQTDITKEYRKLRHAYAQRRYYYKKKGIELPKLEPPVKKPKKGDIGRLQKEIIRKAKKKQVIIPTPPPKPKELAEELVEIEFESLMDMLDGIPELMSSDQSFYRAGAKHKGPARALASSNAHDLKKMLQDAYDKHGARKVMRKLKEHFGKDFSRVLHEIERIAYAMYDKEYSAWGGQGFRRIMTEIDTLLKSID